MNFGYLRIFIYSIALIIVTAILTCFFMAKIKGYRKTDVPLNWEVIDLIDFKESDNFFVIKYLVKINNHYYIMTKNSLFINSSLQHNYNCQYCKKYNINKYNSFCFSTLDGCTSEIHEKINNIKENKVKNKDEK